MKTEEILNYLNYIIKDRNNASLEISHEFLVEDYNNFLDIIKKEKE